MYLTFSNTMLLIGVAGAVLPLVLHLLSRARYANVEWGAMLFLEGMEARQQQNTKLNQVSLLAARMGVVALLALALAQPVLRQWGPEPDARGAALQTAHRGELACIAGAGACAAAAVLLIALGARPATAESTGRAERRGGRAGHGRRILCMLLAVAAGLGAGTLGKRALAWRAETFRLASEQSGGAGQPPRVGLRQRVDAAILLDCSPSMNFDENGHTRFGLAQAAAKQVLAGLQRGDRCSLVLLGHSEDAADADPTADLQSIADRIDALHPGQEPADVAQGLRRAEEVLDQNGRAARDLYVVGDRQALSWRNVNDDFLTRVWPEVLRRSGAPARVFWVPVGNDDADNLAVEAIALTNPPAILHQPAELQVDLRNYGPTARAAAPLSVSVNGRTVFETTAAVAPHRVARVSVPLKGDVFTRAGSQVVTAQIKTAGFRDDDRLDSIVDAIEPIRVLVISGDERDERAGEFRSEADFLRLALAPLQSVRRQGNDPCRVDVTPEDQWPEVELSSYQVVVLANIERFSSAQTRVIEQFVYGGGGLLIAPGSLSRVANYNDQLWRDGSGILPAELDYATSADGSEATAIVGYDSSSPVFQFLRDRPDLALSATIGRYFPVNPRSADAQVLAWYTTGPAFLVESRAGKGRVLLMTTSLDADWSTLPLSNFYLPFVQSAVRYLAAGTLPSRNLALSEPIQLTFEEPVEDRATVETPDGQTQTVSVARFGGVGELRFTGTHAPGVYRVRARSRGSERAVAFAVRGRRDESDLSPLSTERWAELEAHLHVKRIDPNERPIAAVVAGTRQGYDLWPWALAALLLMSVFELVLARHWSKDAY